MTTTTRIERHHYDVVVIGAGGAGLRAAIEARLAGKKTAIISKSLFGKAHTVMAEGGAAAAMGNVNSRDNWQVHFRDTMRGGKFLNNFRMAELHAKESPQRIWELETYGALFDRTKDGKISQRNFGGHEYPRLAHVGDRTGLELIRTLQQKIVSLQQEDKREFGDYDARIKVFSETTITELLLDGDRVAGAFGYYRESGEFILFEAPAVVLATGGVGRSYKVTSNSWEYTGDGHALALRAGATLINMEFLQFHPTGMVWPPSVKGILVTESVRGDGGVLKNSDGKRFMFDYVPDVFRKQYAETEEEADRWYTDPDNNRRPPELLPRDEVARAINSEVKAGRGYARRRRLPGHRHPTFGRGDPPPAAVDVPPVQGAGRRRHHGRADGGRADLSLRDGRRRGGPGLGCRVRHTYAGCSPPVRSPAACTAPTGSAATPCPTCWSSASGRAGTRPAYADGLTSRPKVAVDDGRGRRGDRARAAAAGHRREPVHPPAGPPGGHGRPGRASSGARVSWPTRWSGWPSCVSGWRR